MQRLLPYCFLLATSVGALAQAPAGAPAQGRPATPAPAARPAAPPTQTPAPRPSGQTPAPVTPAPRRAATPAANARGGMVIFVTDMGGGPLRDIRVQATGPTERSGTTDPGGRLTITGMQAGTYRLRFTSDTVTDFEREVVVRGGSNTEVDVALRPAPPPVVVTAPPPPAPAPVVTAAPIGPVGQAQSVSIVDFLDRELIKGEARKETLLACSANTRSTLVQLNQDQPVRLYDGAEMTYYAVAGEGSIRMGTRDIPIKAGTFVSVPRGVSHAITKNGRRPLILLSALSGEPCEQAK